MSHITTPFLNCLSIYQLFKTRMCAFMTYGEFLSKSGSNFRLVVWDSRVQSHRAKASNPWISDDKSQIWATFSRKLTIGHNSTYSNFEIMIFKIFFFIWQNFFFLNKWPPLTQLFQSAQNISFNFFNESLRLSCGC